MADPAYLQILVLFLLLLLILKWKLFCDVTDAQPVLCPLSLAGSTDRSDWNQTSWCCEGSECSARFTTARCHHNQQFGWISLWGGGELNPFAISQAFENPVFCARCAGPRSDCSRLIALSMQCCVLFCFFNITHGYSNGSTTPATRLLVPSSIHGTIVYRRGGKLA